MTSTNRAFEILLAEDNPADVMLVREALQEHGLDCRLHVMNDGARAIGFIDDLDKAATVSPLDLLLLDMHLPRHDGHEILKRLRATEHYARTPVIVMTSSSSPVDRVSATEQAALHYFEKPCNLEGFLQLGAIIRSVLGNTDHAVSVSGRAPDVQ